MNIQGFERRFFCHYSLFLKLDVLCNLHGNMRQIRILTYPNVTSNTTILKLDFRLKEVGLGSKQGRIHGNPVVDGWAGAVMQKRFAI